jgi:drug/metabolite transporter (DMT)-like permease
MPHSEASRATLWMLSGAASFAVMAALTHALGPHCDWRAIALARALFMFSAAALLARHARVPLVFARPRTLWLRSLCGSFSLVCNFYAMTKLPASTAILLSQSHPIWIVLFSPFVIRRPPALAELAGVACALLGVILIQPPQGGDAWPTLVALASSASTAIAMFGLARLRHIDSRAIVAHFALVAAVVATGSLFIPPPARISNAFNAPDAALLLAVGVSGTLGQVCLTRAYSIGRPGTVAIAGLAQVGFALAIDVLLGSQILTPRALLGFSLVLAPSLLLTLHANARARRAAAQQSLASPPAPAAASQPADRENLLLEGGITLGDHDAPPEPPHRPPGSPPDAPPSSPPDTRSENPAHRNTG